MRGCPLVNMYFPVWFLNFLQQLFCSISGANHHHHPVPTPATVEDSSAIASANAANSDSSPEISKERQAFVFLIRRLCFFLRSPNFLGGRVGRGLASVKIRNLNSFLPLRLFFGREEGGGGSHPSLSSEVCWWWC